MTNSEKKQGFLGRAKQFIKFRIIHVDDSPHRIALGVAMGFFTAFLPFLGLHTISALFLAFVTRANKAVALLCSWICNPFTVVPIFIPSYLLGRKVVSFFRMRFVKKVGRPDPSEIVKVKWLEPAAAVKRLTYRSERKIVRKMYPRVATK